MTKNSLRYLADLIPFLFTTACSFCVYLTHFMPCCLIKIGEKQSWNNISTRHSDCRKWHLR